MHFSFASGSSLNRRIILFAAVILLAPNHFSRESQRPNVKVEYDDNVPASVKAIVKALIQGEALKPEISESELRHRQAYAVDRLGGAKTDRGRFYIVLGPPNELESRPGEAESWTYRIRGNQTFRVAFASESPQPDVMVVEYKDNVPAKVKEAVETLRRGETPKTDISDEELKLRRVYATERFGSLETDRGRFYISLGPPSEVESHVSSPSWEKWVFGELKFTVTFMLAP